MENPFANASKKVNPEAPESSPESLVRRTPEGEEYSLLPEYHQVIQEIADNANLSVDQVRLAYQMEGRNVWTYGLDQGRELELPYTKSKIEANSAASIPENELDDYNPDSLSPRVILNAETGKPEISNGFSSFKWKIDDNSKVTIERNGLNISFDPNIEDGLLGENPYLHYQVDGNLPVDQVLLLEDFIKDDYLSGLTKTLRHVSYRRRSEDSTNSGINPVALEMRERKQKLYKLAEDLIQDLLKKANEKE
jgi:hypothetical protein